MRRTDAASCAGADATGCLLASSTPSTLSPIYTEAKTKKFISNETFLLIALPTDLILQVVPPIRPSLLHTPFLLNDSIFHNSAQNAKRHGHTMIVVAMNANTLLELLDRFTVDLETVFQLFCLHAEFGCLWEKKSKEMN